MPFSPGDIVGGKYRVDRLLGAGGMGVVVAASHVDLDQPVALKFILPEALDGKDAVERFMREARAVARLKSEHVAKVYDVGHDLDPSRGIARPFMVLELLEGMDLSKLNKQKGPFAIADAVEYVLQVCEALVEAHTAGIVHRDLKPQNIFVTRRLNGTPLVKVLDFGISKSIGPAAVGQLQLTDSQAVIGSPLYMAPEQMRSARAAEIRSDIWAIGVILYELLAGQPPFDGETVTEVCIRVVNEPPSALDMLRPQLDPALVKAVMRCLEKDPAQRWQNVAQLAAAIEPFARSSQQGSPVRPWRSFEDTLDSQNAQVARVAPPATFADETGPSTAITVPTNEQLAHVAKLVQEAPKVMPSVRPGVSTDVTWGQITTDPPPSKRAEQQPRSFAKGLAAGVVVSIAAGIIFVVMGLNREPKVAPAVSAPPPPAAASLPEPATKSAAPNVTDLPPAPAVTTAAAVGTSAVTGPIAPEAKKAPPAPRASAKTAKPSPTSPTPVAAEPTATPAVAPNGAPILR